MSQNKKIGNIPNWLKRARDHWDNTGSKRPAFAVVPKKGQRSVWDFPRPPVLEKVNQLVQVKHQGKTIAKTRNAWAVLETASPPTYYISKSDIDMSMLAQVVDKTSMCEWKGSAMYWALSTRTDQPVAWSYPNPFPEFEPLKNHLAFYPQNLDCFIDKVLVKAQASQFYAGWITPDLTGPFKGEKGTEHW